ncbi:hypothetical protein COV28_02145 [candidate division WWE3 bacterium CG10_big_fil_rev_8_21_14_0_10_48_23]|nr:MAG: hypothetical protein COV28_02145 [candidate division WWE3 bacterium CG10_big_fil_rev_8_21_14_0_10_48_23]
MKLEAKNKFKKLTLLTLTILLGIFLLFSFLLPVAAAGARLFLSPSSGTYYAGSYLSVEVLVNTGGNATNAYKAVLAYPTDKLEAVSVSSGGSICSLWITQTKSTLECGTPTPYKGTTGRIGTITFLVKAAGTATVSIANGQVKKADGAGTEILSVRDSASFSLQEPPAGVPVISSSTHPDQNGWYQSRTAEFSWNSPEGTDGFSYLLSQKPNEVPDDTSEGAETSKTYENLADGTWYFHLKAKTTEATPAGGQGWSFTNHFRIQIDSEPPEDFEIVSDPPADRVFRAPLLSFAATDKLSGVDRCEISFDGGEFEVTISPYRFNRIRGGIHEVVVQAVDQAGNIKDSRLTLSVIGVPSPTIIRPTEGENIPLFAPLGIKITTVAPGTVELLLDSQLFATLDGSIGSELEHTYRKILSPRGHKLSAVFVNAEGIESAPAEVNFKVNPGSVYLLGFVVPGYIFYSVLLIAVSLLVVLFIKWRKRRKKKAIEESKNRS